MTHPVFFSFAGDAKQYAERLKGKFSDEIVYMYSRTGVDGVDFPQEILEEIAQCQLFVVFWSAAYIDADVRRPWCRRELITAAKRVSSGSLTNYIIIPIDSTPLESLIKDPDTGETSDVLQPMRETRRAFSVPVAWKAVETEIARELAHFSDAALPELFRADLQRQLRESIENGSYQTKAPVTFVSGFHGSGRKTLIRGLMQADFRHLTEHRLGIDGSDGPEDFLQLVWGEVLQKTIKEQRAFLKAAHRNPDLLKGYFRQLGPQLQSRRAYLVISKDDVTDFADVVPHWFADYFPLITPTVQPLIFVVISRTLPPIFKRALNGAQDVHIPTLEDHESARLASMHIAARDPNRVSRWKEHLPFILEAGANSPKLLVDIVRLASRRSSLDFLKQDAELDVSRFDERVSNLLDWAWPQIKEKPEQVLLLDILNSLTVAHYETLKEVFATRDQAVGDLLYELIQVGLVEHLGESTYRIPSALRRKLNFYLINPQLREQSSQILKQFAKSVQIGQDEWGGVALSNLLHIRLSTDTNIDPEDLAFVTAAMLFKAGWQKYRKNQYSSALLLLKRSFSQLTTVGDDSTKLEIARFYGLAAAREGAAADVAIACNYLANPSNFSPRIFERAKSFSPFIRGLSYRLDQEFDRACEEYEDSLSLLPEGSFSDQQRAMILNELVQCILKAHPVNYERAVALAEESCAIRTTPNALDILLRALLAQTFDDSKISAAQSAKNKVEIIRREIQLKAKCDTNKLSFHTMRLVDRLEKEAYERVEKNQLPYGALDLSEPIHIIETAYLQTGENILLSRKWDLMLRTEVNRDWRRLHTESSNYLDDKNLNRTFRGVAARIRILTFDLNDVMGAKQAYVELDKHTASGSIPRQAAKEIRRKLDQGTRLTSSRMLTRVIED